jgi:hypothetical protein
MFLEHNPGGAIDKIQLTNTQKYCTKLSLHTFTFSLAEFNLFIYIFLFFEFQQEEVSFAS